MVTPFASMLLEYISSDYAIENMQNALQLNEDYSFFNDRSKSGKTFIILALNG